MSTTFGILLCQFLDTQVLEFFINELTSVSASSLDKMKGLRIPICLICHVDIRVSNYFLKSLYDSMMLEIF